MGLFFDSRQFCGDDGFKDFILLIILTGIKKLEWIEPNVDEVNEDYGNGYKLAWKAKPIEGIMYTVTCNSKGNEYSGTFYPKEYVELTVHDGFKSVKEAKEWCSVH